MKKRTKQKGFTLVELVLYLGLAVMVLTISVNLMATVSRGQVNAQVRQDLYANSRMVINQITQKIRESEYVLADDCTFGTNPGVLVLDYPGTTDIIFDTYTKNLDKGGAQVEITKLRIKEGTGDYVDITTDDIDVTDFSLEILRRGLERQNVGVSLTLESGDSQISLVSAASVRD
jgi:type II secretory pathway pseudopilin PulG